MARETKPERQSPAPAGPPSARADDASADPRSPRAVPGPGAAFSPSGPRDADGRTIDYLRISITDRCNERCLYCMPNGLPTLKSREELLSYEEILRVVRVTVGLGFRKFRVTGGEPLVRKDVVPFLLNLAAVPGVEWLGLSTNGLLLAPIARELKDGGLTAVNISLDTLDPTEYRTLTKGDLSACVAGIDAAVEAGIPSVKLNAVLLRGMSESRIVPLARFAGERKIALRFIEWMPVSSEEMRTTYLSAEEVRSILGEVMTLTPDDLRLGHGPARYYRTSEGGVIGFISAMSDEHFCDQCNKIRLTSDGKVRPCLGDIGEFDLRARLRSEAPDEEVARYLVDLLHLKPKTHSFHLEEARDGAASRRGMSAIGG